MTLEEIIADPEKARARIADLERAITTVQAMEPWPARIHTFTATPTLPEDARQPMAGIDIEREVFRLRAEEQAYDCMMKRSADERYLAERIVHHIDGDATNNDPKNLLYIAQPKPRKA